MENPSLKAHFKDEWYKFTSDVMDENLVQTILGNEIAPDNTAHRLSREGFVSACGQLMDENGASFAAALDHLKARKSA